MKKSTIVLLCIGFALLIIGGGTFFLTWSMGAVGYEGEFLQFGFGSHDTGGLMVYDNNTYDNQDTYHYGGKTYENKTLNLDGKNGNLTQVELNLGAADVTVTQDGGPGYVSGENFPENQLSFWVADGKLTVQDSSQGQLFSFGRRKRQRKLKINLPPEINLNTMTVNRGTADVDIRAVSAGELTITDGAGDLYLEDVSVGALNLSAGVGDCTLAGLNSTGSVEIVRGAGDVELTRAHLAGDLNISSGVGDFNLEGSVTGNISLDAGAGDCDLELIGNQNDYYFTLHKGFGDISINDEELSSNQKNFGQEGAPYTVDIQGGVGDIEVNFRSGF